MAGGTSTPAQVGGSGKRENLDTELNLVPIIDCFVILICFLLFTASFTQLVFLEAKITENTAAAMTKSRNELDKFHLVIELKDSGYSLKLTGSDVKSKNITIENAGGEYNYAQLHAQLIELKTMHPDRFSVDIEVKANEKQKIKYEYVLRTIDSVRHLTDQEYSLLRTAEKKVQNLELSDEEKERLLPEQMVRLAEAVIGSPVAAKADTKALFPDIALIGVY